jgi:hypothetical protein
MVSNLMLFSFFPSKTGNLPQSNAEKVNSLKIEENMFTLNQELKILGQQKELALAVVLQIRFILQV